MLWDRKQRRLLLCEILHLCVVVPPFADQNTQVDWPAGEQSRVSWQDLVTVAIFFRLYHVVRFVYSQSSYLLPSAHFFTYFPLRRLEGVYNSPKFIILAQMTISPFKTIMVVSATIMLLSGLLFHIVERSANSSLSIIDGPWFIAVTQLTVGYGDTLPKTDLGRLLAMGPGLCAMLTLSLVMTYSMMYMEMTMNQKNLASELTHRAYLRDKLASLTATFLQRWWRLKLSRKRKFDSERLKRLLEYKSVHDLFKRKFALILQGSPPELDSHIRTIHKKIEQLFGEICSELNGLPRYSAKAGSFSTEKFNLVAKILVIKQAFLRCRLIGTKEKKEIRGRRSMPPIRRKHKRSSIVEKKASDMAVKRLKVRLSVMPSAESLESMPSDPEVLRKKNRRSSLQ